MSCRKYVPGMVKDVLDRVELRLKAVGLSAKAASLKAGLSEDAIRNMRRAAKDPSRGGVSTRTLQLLAPTLKTNAGWLIDGSGNEHDLEPSALSVPVLSWVSAGALRASDHVEDMDTAPRVPASDLDPAGHWIALRVEGDSMDRISPPDSLIFVNTRDRLLVPNACYVFSDGNGGTTYKRWRPNPNRLEPVSTNPDHEPLFVAEGAEPGVIGRVRRSVLEM